MSVGGQASKATIDSNLTNLSVGVRSLMEQVTDLFTFINGQADGMTVLADLGYSTVPTASNPGGVSDAQLASNMISYLDTLAGIYYGNVTQPSTFNFNNALSVVWGGQ